jgi:hypothetical protein
VSRPAFSSALTYLAHLLKNSTLSAIAAVASSPRIYGAQLLNYFLCKQHKEPSNAHLSEARKVNVCVCSYSKTMYQVNSSAQGNFGNPSRRLKLVRGVYVCMLSNSDNDESGSVCWLKFTLEKLWGGASILMQYGVLRAEKPGVQ